MGITARKVLSWRVNDFTTFVPSDRLHEHLDGAGDVQVKEFLDQTLLSLDDDIEFIGPARRKLSGRALACWCCNRQAVSLTVRSKDQRGDREYLTAKSGQQHSTWEIQDKHKDTVELCKFLQEAVFTRDKSSGIVAFFGETGSRKSSFARGLIDRYLKELTKADSNAKRRPHLLTFEDPIEEFYGPLKHSKGRVELDPKKAGQEWLRMTQEKLFIDYTPRCIGEGKDTPTLNAGLLNAVRQKPAVVYVGETRTADDWRSVIKFGGTGHLIVTTSHAGTLQESVSQIFEAAEANTPAKRSFIAGRILAVIHLRAYDDFGKTPGSRQVVIPTMWRRTPAGANTLVTDGLGSILPNNPGHISKVDSGMSSLGRHWFGQYINTKIPRHITDALLQQLMLDDLQSL